MKNETFPAVGATGEDGRRVYEKQTPMPLSDAVGSETTVFVEIGVRFRTVMHDGVGDAPGSRKDLEADRRRQETNHI